MSGPWGAVAISLLLTLGCGRTARDDQAGTGGNQGVGGAASHPAADCAVSLASFDSRYCAVYEDGSVWCWGYVGGASAPSNFEPSSEPLQVVGLKDIERVVLGPRHSCAIDRNRALWCWGDNESGQIDASQPSPLPPSPYAHQAMPSSLKGVGLGDTQTCVIDFLSHVYCWGKDAAGELAGPHQISVDGSPEATLPSGTPDLVDELGQIWDLSTWAAPRLRRELSADNAWHAFGQPETCLLKRSGSLWCSNYVVDDGEDVIHAKVQLGENVVQAGVGEMFSCALPTEGGVWCEGFDLLGQTGRGTNNTFNEGGFVPDLSDVSALATGRASVCALTADGSVLCWGAYALERQSNVPTQVSGCSAQGTPPEPPAPPRPTTHTAPWRLEQAGQARAEIRCACALESSDPAVLDACARAENFAPLAPCLAALAPDDPAWACLAESYWQDALCYATCSKSIDLPSFPSCGDMSCAETQPSAVERYCKRRHRCGDDTVLERETLCDGRRDCSDGSDELNCKRTGFFECSPEERIPIEKVCDGSVDCRNNGADENCFE